MKASRRAVSPTSQLLRVITALEMAAPLCLAIHFEVGLDHCVEASVSGAEALTRFNIAARAVPRALEALHRSSGISLSCGVSSQQLYERRRAEDPSIVPFEIWKDMNADFLPREGLTTHMIIEAMLDGESVRVDLTLGQLRAVPRPEAKTIPWQIVLTGEQFASSDWIIRYREPLYTSDEEAELDALVRRASGSGMVDDLYDLMRLALSCDLDESRFYEEFKRRQPQTYVTAASRIAKLGGL